ncbi:MAG: glutamine--fructose-6-phosphate transaminase (isomerizing) [Candidatus Beckwithbacteria bacterium]
MCGIFGVIGDKKQAAQTVLSGLKKLEYRGYDSWGITVKQGQRLVRERHVGKIGEAKTKLPVSAIGLGHTRWATHGGVTVGNAHPHLDCTKTLSLVHNGIVENFRTIKETLIAKHKFLSETDTEVALHLIEEKTKKQPLLQAVQQSFNQLNGMNALIVISAKTDQLIAVKNGSPLIIGLGKNQNFIASDVWALLDHTSRIIFLEDNQMVQITADKVKLFSIKTGKALKLKIMTLDWQAEQSRLGKFHHYMEKEIFDQPKILTNLSQLPQASIDQITKLYQASQSNYLLGCGTAYYAALFGQYLFNLFGLEAEAIIGSEFKKYQRLLHKNKTFTLLSQSGETIDVVEAVNLAKKQHLKIIGITNVLGSTLYRKSDFKLLLQAGQEVAVASTKAFTAKLATLLQLGFNLNHQLVQAQNLIRLAAKASLNLCLGQDREKIKSLARLIKDQEHIFVVGKLLSYPIALETALKIKEVSYIHAEAYASGELKHGPIALIDKGTPCIVIAPLDETYSDIISSAHEMKARGGLIIGISPQADPVFDFHLQVPDLKQATAIPITVIAQLLAYDLAISRGLNPDKPRNLAKSVTVK